MTPPGPPFSDSLCIASPGSPKWIPVLPLDAEAEQRSAKSLRGPYSSVERGGGDELVAFGVAHRYAYARQAHRRVVAAIRRLRVPVLRGHLVSQPSARPARQAGHRRGSRGRRPAARPGGGGDGGTPPRGPHPPGPVG